MGGTFVSAKGGTFVSAMGGTFETVPISWRFYFTKIWRYKVTYYISKRKDQKTETHLLSDDEADEVDELAVLLGINLYSAEDHRIFITDVTRMMIEGAE